MKENKLNKVTRADVARHARLSVATVSYVLNNSRGVSKKSREKVLAAVKQLNYHPDMAARTMVMNESRMITVIANDLSNSMYGEIIIEIEKAAMRKGYFVTICSGSLALSEYLNIILARRIDAVFIASIPSKVSSNDIKAFIDNGVRVICGNYLLGDSKNIHRLDVDYRNGIKLALEYLKAHGHTKISYLNGFRENYELDERFHAFCEVMSELFPSEPLRVVFNPEGPEMMMETEGAVIAEQMLKIYPETTAVLCSSDFIAFGALNCFLERGIKVPEDISVIGMENTIIGKFSNPPLTSVSFSREEFGKKVVDIVVKSGVSEDVQSEHVEMEICERKSVGAPRKGNLPKQ